MATVTPVQLQPQRKKKPHQIFHRAFTGLVNNQFSPLHSPLERPFIKKSSPRICYFIASSKRVLPAYPLMSKRQSGRGRGGGNLLAPPYNPHRSEAPTSPDDTRMGEDSPSPVQTVTTEASVSTNGGEPTTLESL